MDKPDLYSLLKQLNAIGGIAEIGQPGFCLLMALWQKSNELNWAHQFTMTNTELLYRSGYNSEKAMIEKRNKMSQQGYFQYIAPKNRRHCGTYIMNFNLIDYFLKHSNTNNINGNSEVNSDRNSGRNSEVNINKPNQTNIITITNTRTREELNIFDFVEKELGYPLSSTQMEMIMKWQESNSDELIRCAVGEALAQNVRTTAYIDKILQSWEASGIKTPEQVAIAKEQFKKKKEERKNGKFSNLGRKNSAESDNEFNKIDWSKFGS